MARLLLPGLLVVAGGCGEREVAERELPKGIETIADMQADAKRSSSERGEAGDRVTPAHASPSLDGAAIGGGGRAGVLAKGVVELGA